jgi:hypothetical protein
LNHPDNPPISMLVPLNRALDARLQALAHRIASVRLVKLLSPAAGRLAGAPQAVDALLASVLDDAVAAAGPGGTLILMTERIDAAGGLALAGEVLHAGAYALVAASAIPVDGAPVAPALDEAPEGSWRSLAVELGGGAWTDVEPGAAVAINLLLPIAASARIRLPRAAQPSLRTVAQ